jgi:hypothetical protein
VADLTLPVSDIAAASSTLINYLLAVAGGAFTVYRAFQKVKEDLVKQLNELQMGIEKQFGAVDKQIGLLQAAQTHTANEIGLRLTRIEADTSAQGRELERQREKVSNLLSEEARLQERLETLGARIVKLETKNTPE